jgi:hypothetical protein
VTAPLLVLPDESAPTAALRAARTLYASRLLGLLASAARAGAAATTVVTRLGQLWRTRRDAAVDLVVEPPVAVMLHTGRIDEAIRLLAAELAWSGLLPDPIELVSDEPWSVWSIARDVAVDVPARRRLTIGGGETPKGKTSHPFPRIGSHGFALMLVDANPLSHLEEHPEKHGNAVSLGGRPVDEWLAALDEALAIVERALPSFAAELRAGVRGFVPVGWEPERHLSASYREYVGVVYLTLHPSTLTIAEAIVHEAQHGKLNLLSHLDPLLENGFTFFHRSPVRPDPRPLFGILLAAHAFVAVAEMLSRLPPSPRLAEVVAKNQEALDVLDAHAAPTPLGRALLDRLHALHARHLAVVPERDRPRDVIHDV